MARPLAGDYGCSNPRCTRIHADQVLLECRCGAGFCTEACWIQEWHAGHQDRCPCADELLAAARAQQSRRRGAALLATLALSRRVPDKDAEGTKAQPVAKRNESSKSHFASSKASSWISLAEAESLPDPDKGHRPFGCCVDDFHILEQLGEGSCGTVAKVAHVLTGEVFALKAIARQRVKEHQLQKYVEREVATQQRLNHPNIVRLYEYFEDVERVYLLLEFAPEGTLYAKIHQQGCLAHAEAASIFADVTRAVMHLHRHGIIHRDLKPENVLLFEDGRAKLADFGWCAESTDDGRKTFCGTMDYLSPEMVTRKPHDHCVDTWALGVLLYEMLTGKPPFAGRSTADCVERILSVSLSVPVSVPAGAADLIRSLLKAEAEERLTLTAALHWPWLEDMLTDPLATDQEMPILVEPVECEDLIVPPLNLQVPATMHLQPQPKCASQRSSPRGRTESCDNSSSRPNPSGDVLLTPGAQDKTASSRTSSNSSMSFFGSALRPHDIDWTLPSARGERQAAQEASAVGHAGAPKEGAFLLQTCLLPAAGMQRQPSSQNQSQDVSGTRLQGKLEDFLKPKSGRRLLNAEDVGPSVRFYLPRGSTSSASSRWGSEGADADASTDVEGDPPSLPTSGSIQLEGKWAASMAPATNAVR